MLRRESATRTPSPDSRDSDGPTPRSAPPRTTDAPALGTFRALRDREVRDRMRRFAVEGARFVHEAIRTRTPIDGALVCPSFGGAATAGAVQSLTLHGVPVRHVSRGGFESVSVADTPSGVALVVHQRWSAAVRPRRGETPLWIALGRIRSPGNLGTLFRTATAAGASGAILLDPETDPHHPVCVRASMGAVLGLPLVRMTHAHLDAWKRRIGALVVGTAPDAVRDFRQMPRGRPCVVMLGCEREGMSQAQRNVCDVTVSIPMAHGCDSLNVAVAAGIVLFAVRQT